MSNQPTHGLTIAEPIVSMTHTSITQNLYYPYPLCCPLTSWCTKFELALNVRVRSSEIVSVVTWGHLASAPLHGANSSRLGAEGG